VTRWLPLPFLTLFIHGQEPLPIAQPLIVTGSYTTSVDLREYRRNAAVRYEARRWDVPYRIAYAVSHAENYNGDSTALNPRTGAIGILQIHPVHFGALAGVCYGSGSMTNLKRNACYGMKILRGYYDQTGSWSAALRKYLGYKTNTKALLAYLDDVIDHMAGLD